MQATLISTAVQSGLPLIAVRPASTAQLTGFTKETLRIHGGIRVFAIKIDDKKVIGSRIKLTAPITDSIFRIVSASAFDKAPNETPTSTAHPINTAIPPMPPGYRAPNTNPRVISIDDCTTVVKAR